MPIAALIALLPLASDAFQQIAGLISRMQADGRAQTTAEETAALQAALARVGTADGRFDAAFGVQSAVPPAA